MRLSINGNFWNMPDFLIVGAARSATTTLFYYLDQHPDTSMSLVKEPHFFSFYSHRPHYMELSRDRLDAYIYNGFSYSIEDYSSLYKPMHASNMLGEASTSYLYFHEQVIKNVTALYGQLANQIKIIILLRNPVDRAWSHFLFHKRNGRENLDFSTAVNPQCITTRMNQGISYNWDYLGFGRYYEQVKAYRDNFDNVLVVLTEDFTRHPVGTVMTIMRFIGINPRIPDNMSGIYNVSGKPKNILSSFISKAIYQPNPLARFIKRALPLILMHRLKYVRFRAADYLMTKEEINEKDRRYLVDYYRPDINKLSGLLDRNIEHWLN
jgi:hypothetical protein